jgi:nitroreductase
MSGGYRSASSGRRPVRRNGEWPSGIGSVHAGQVTELSELDRLVRSRRTSMLVQRDREVPGELVERLCELATWAPNHKRTWPWGFALCTGDGRLRLGEAFVTDMVTAGVGDEAKREKTRGKYARTPAVLVVGCAPSVKAGLRDDDRDAVAAGIQNLLLGATAAGLASYWSTAPVAEPESVGELCGFEPGTRVVGLVYLGWPSDQHVEVPVRPPVALQIVNG